MDNLNILVNGRRPPPPPLRDTFPNITEGWLALFYIYFHLKCRNSLVGLEINLSPVRKFLLF